MLLKLVSIVLFSLLSNADSRDLAESDNNLKDNIYFCSLFQPSETGGEFTEVRVTPDDQLRTVELFDGEHYVDIKWWDWTLNVSIRKKGQVREVSGGATHTHLKIRSHQPKVSMECYREN